MIRYYCCSKYKSFIMYLSKWRIIIY